MKLEGLVLIVIDEDFFKNSEAPIFNEEKVSYMKGNSYQDLGNFFFIVIQLHMSTITCRES